MSLCQSNGSSCGACCGLFNIDYPPFELKKILTERTKYFSENVDYSKRETVISYREDFEKKESAYPKKDATIYNCPFLGYIDGKNRIGCMIHPVKTGDPKSQNFSFYGASICQTYDCRNKERVNAIDWENIFDSLGLDECQYSNLAGDHILITRIEEFFLDIGISLTSMFQDHSNLLKRILLYKISKRTSNITSFEIDMESSIEGSKFQKLVDKLGLVANEELFLDLDKLKN
jgi:hypothetical protein